MATKQFRLTISNAAEDYPRLILGRGNACGGAFLLALRLDTGACVLTHKVGKVIRVFSAAGAPRMPDVIVENQAAADALIAALKRDLPKLREPARRGTWSATLFCDDRPIVMLERKVASYGVIRICSDPKTGRWDWRAERAERHFAGREDKAGNESTLHTAMERAYAAADGLVSTACTRQATLRRASYDSAYAADHPNRLAPERADPTVPRGKKKPAAAPAPTPASKPSTRKPAAPAAAPAPTPASKPSTRKPAAPAPAAATTSDPETELMKLMTAGIRSAVQAATAGQQ